MPVEAATVGAWLGVAALSLLLALVAASYGLPERNSAEPVARVAVVPEARDDTRRIDAEMARLRTETAALRQSVDTLRTQVGLVNDRIDGLTSDVTGSIPSIPRAAAVRESAQPAPGSALRAASQATTAPPTTPIGIEVGSFPDFNALRTAWGALLRDQAMLTRDLSPLATVRARGGRLEVVLLAGPLPSTRAAAARCGDLEKAGVACLPAFFTGLAVDAP